MTNVDSSDRDRPHSSSTANPDVVEAVDGSNSVASTAKKQPSSVPTLVVPTPERQDVLTTSSAPNVDAKPSNGLSDVPPLPPPPPMRLQLKTQSSTDEAGVGALPTASPTNMPSRCSTDFIITAGIELPKPSTESTLPIASNCPSLTLELSSQPNSSSLDVQASRKTSAIDSTNRPLAVSETDGCPVPHVINNSAEPLKSSGSSPLSPEKDSIDSKAALNHCSAQLVSTAASKATDDSPNQDFVPDCIESSVQTAKTNPHFQEQPGSDDTKTDDPCAEPVDGQLDTSGLKCDKDVASSTQAVDEHDEATENVEQDLGLKVVSDMKTTSNETLSTLGAAFQSEGKSEEHSEDHNADEREDDDNSFMLPASNRPLPKHLPKVAKNRPENARVFIGNLASEYTSTHDIVKVFHKYGTLIEEPVLRRSFGFVQYSTAEAAKAAVLGEQGRIIGGIAIDLSIADNREVRKGAHIVNNTPFTHPKPGSGGFGRNSRVREREGGAGSYDGPLRKRRRSISPPGSRKGGVHPPQFRRQRPEPRNGVHMRILCMSPTAKAYARHCENTFRTMTGSRADVLHIVAANLGDALGRAMRDQVPYVMVVASKDVEDGTCTIRTLERTGYEKSGRGNGVIPLREAIEVCLIERGTLVPTHVAHGPGGHIGAGAGGMNGTASRSTVSAPGLGRGAVGTAQWLTQGGPDGGPHGPDGGIDVGKPSWMNGPRPPHPSNIRMQNSVGPGGMGPPGLPGVNNPGMNGGPSFGYNAMDSGRVGLGQSGLGIGAAQGMMTAVQGVMGGPGRSDGYSGSMGPGFAGTSNVGAGGGITGSIGAPQDFGRQGGQANYAIGSFNQSGFNDPRLGHQGIRMNDVNVNISRDGEYDPAAASGGRSLGADGFGNWNRDQGAMGRGPYVSGGIQGGNSRGNDGGNFERGMDGQQYRAATFGAGHGYENDRIGQSARNVGGPIGMYGGGGGGDINGGGGQGYSGNMYGGDTYGVYGATNYRGNEGHNNQQDVRRFGQESQVGFEGSINGYGEENVHTYGVRENGRGEGWAGDSNRATGGIGTHVGIPGTNVNGQYGAGGRMSHGMGGADLRRGATMDIGKISHLISTFQQQKQQAGMQQPSNGSQQGHETNGGRIGRASRDTAPSRLSAGSMSQFLANPAVQQALQNIGGVGRLGTDGGPTNGATPSQVQAMPMWPGGNGAHHSIGTGGVGRGGRGNDGRGGQIGPTSQGYY